MLFFHSFRQHQVGLLTYCWYIVGAWLLMMCFGRILRSVMLPYDNCWGRIFGVGHSMMYVQACCIEVKLIIRACASSGVDYMPLSGLKVKITTRV